jgi:hypothetical protein
MYYQSGAWYAVRENQPGIALISYRVGNLTDTTWTEVDANFAGWVGYYQGGHLTSVVDPVTQGVMVVGTSYDDGIAFSEQISFNSNSGNAGNWLTDRSPSSVLPSDAALANTQIINSSIAAYNGRFLIAWSNRVTGGAGGGNGIVATADQGATWYNCTGLPSDRIYTSVVAGYNNSYATFTSIGNIYYSTDGIAFTEDISQYNNIAATLGGNSGYVGIRGNGNVSVNYSRYVAPSTTINFVATASGNLLSVSSDGITWTAYTAPVNLLSRVTFAQNKFVGLDRDGNVSYTSTDGITWTVGGAIPTGGTFSPLIAYNGVNTFVSIQAFSNRAATSSDGITWTARTLPGDSADYYWSGVAYGNGIWVAVSYRSGPGSNTVSSVTSSDNGATWTQRPILGNGTASWSSIIYAANTFVVTSGTVDKTLTSTDGINWTEHTLPDVGQSVGVAYGANLFVSVNGGYYTGYYFTSPDGVTWTKRTTIPAQTWNAITYGSGLFVAVPWGGSDVVAVSSDGITWTSGTISSPDYWATVTART